MYIYIHIITYMIYVCTMLRNVKIIQIWTNYDASNNLNGTPQKPNGMILLGKEEDMCR